MGNENLRNALRTAGLTPEEFADIIKVDPKTVQRWVAGTTTPYPRHRASISRALDLTEHDLWPDQRRSQTRGDEHAELQDVARDCDVRGAWASADDDSAPDLVAFINRASGPIDLLDSCCGVQITGEVTDALLAQADDGRAVRILTDGQAPHWEALIDHPHIRIYLSEIPGEYWLIKTKDVMLLTINLEHEPETSPPPPTLQLTPVIKGGMFDRLATRFEELWTLTGETGLTEARSEADSIESNDELSDHSLIDQCPPPGLAPTDVAGRRWPRRRA